jgi:hypothetical protein
MRSKAASVGAARQKVSDGHPCTAGPVKEYCIAGLKLILHRIAASVRPCAAIPHRATQLPRVNEDIYPTTLCGAAQLGQQLVSEVIGRNHGRPQLTPRAYSSPIAS